MQSSPWSSSDEPADGNTLDSDRTLGDGTPSPSPGTSSGPPESPDLPNWSGHARAARPHGAAVWLVALGAALLAGSALFGAGFLLGRQTVLTDGTPRQLSADLQPFWDAFDSIQERYAGVPVSRHTLVEGAIAGMFKALGDPFSTYLTGEAYRASLTGLTGQFEGIGAVISTEDPAGAQGCQPAGPSCRVVIVEVIENAPAARAGLRAGDAILEVDGKSVSGMTTDQVVGAIRGPRGTTVALRIGRGTGAPFAVRIVRALVTSVDVTSRLVAGGTVGYIRISSFGSGVAADFTRQLRTLLRPGVHGIVLDLRGNPGGFIDQARTIASQFVASGPIYWEQLAGGSARAVDAQPGGIATDRALRLVVLVDKGTASASEILAGAIQATGRGILLGTTTYGKGTVQEWQPLGSGAGGFKLTIARWLTPSRQWINGRGLTPNVVYQPPASAPPGSDPALGRALELLADPAPGMTGAAAPGLGGSALARAPGMALAFGSLGR
ncbi:MAG: S41 family peptidase [Candidatus Limnocylindrales bacterium]